MIYNWAFWDVVLFFHIPGFTSKYIWSTIKHWTNKSRDASCVKDLLETKWSASLGCNQPSGRSKLCAKPFGCWLHCTELFTARKQWVEVLLELWINKFRVRCARPVRGKDGVPSSTPTARAKSDWTDNFNLRESAFRGGSDSVLRWRCLTGRHIVNCVICLWNAGQKWMLSRTNSLNACVHTGFQGAFVQIITMSVTLRNQHCNIYIFFYLSALHFGTSLIIHVNDL